MEARSLPPIAPIPYWHTPVPEPLHTQQSHPARTRWCGRDIKPLPHAGKLLFVLPMRQTYCLRDTASLYFHLPPGRRKQRLGGWGVGAVMRWRRGAGGFGAVAAGAASPSGHRSGGRPPFSLPGGLDRGGHTRLSGHPVPCACGEAALHPEAAIPCRDYRAKGMGRWGVIGDLPMSALVEMFLLALLRPAARFSRSPGYVGMAYGVSGPLSGSTALRHFLTHARNLRKGWRLSAA